MTRLFSIILVALTLCTLPHVVVGQINTYGLDPDDTRDSIRVKLKASKVKFKEHDLAFIIKTKQQVLGLQFDQVEIQVDIVEGTYVGTWYARKRKGTKQDLEFIARVCESLQQAGFTLESSDSTGCSVTDRTNPSKTMYLGVVIAGDGYVKLSEWYL